MLWFLLHWKLVGIVVAGPLIAFAIFTPVVAKFLWRHRVKLAVLALLFASHGAVAVGTQRWFDRANEIARLEKERDEALLKLTVLEVDREAAEKQRIAELEWADHAKGLKDALTDPDRICFDEPDADRVHQLFR